MAQGLTVFQGSLLANAAGQLVGAMGLDGKEYLLPAAANTPTALTGNATNGASLFGATSVGSGNTLTISSGAVLRLGATSSFAAAVTDSSGTPGNATQNTDRGRAAFAAAASTVTITNSQVAANSTVLAQLGGADATLTSVRVTPGAGSFTVTGNAAATGTTPFDYFIIQN